MRETYSGTDDFGQHEEVFLILQRIGEILRLALFLTHAHSVDIWAQTGMLQRELALYQQLPSEVTDIGILSYGGKSDSRFALGDDRIHAITNRFRLPPRLRSAWMARLHGGYFRSVDILKTNQLSGAEAAVRAKKLWDKPLIVRAGNIWSHAAELRFGTNSAEHDYARASEANSFKYADRVIVTDAGKAEFISGEYGVSQEIVRVIPNYVDTRLFSPGTGDTTGKPVITFVGRLSSPKKPDLLIQAVADMDVQLNIIGSGHMRPELEAMAEGTKADIRFIGNVPSSDIASYFQSSALFSMPTVLEGQPKAILEAMSAGLPVVVSTAPGVTEVIEDGKTGVLAENSVEAFRESIEWLLDNPAKRAEIGENARAYVQRNNSLDVVVTDEVAVYSELVNS